MVSIVWFILSLFGVCAFTWLPIFIDAVITLCLLVFMNPEGKNDTQNFATIAVMSVAYFAFYKSFFALTVSGWWVLLAPVAMPVAALFPGGFTIVNLLLDKNGLIALPTWGLVVGIILDVLIAGIMVYTIIEEVKNKKK